MLYLDNAATSYHKPENVYAAVDYALRNCSGNPGRSGHKAAMCANDIVRKTRMLCSSFINAESAERIIFCSNATDALNLAIKGIVRTGEHVVTTSLEHNSVARPLESLRKNGVEITKVPCSLNSGVNLHELEKAFKHNTALVVAAHVSNVTGTVNDIAGIGMLCRKHGIIFLVDAAQSAGSRYIDVQNMNIDMLAFPGHKSLLGPQGTGGLYVRTGVDMKPLKEGGTGSRSESLEQPRSMPDGYESGTLNVPGIAGLGAGVRFIIDTGINKIQEKEAKITDCLIEGISHLEGVSIYAPDRGRPRGSVVSFNVNGRDPQEVACILDTEFDIAVRSGLHCAPDAHKTIGTLCLCGTVRVSPNYFTGFNEIDVFINALDRIVHSND